MHLLIPYVQIRNHEDPNLREFTYGDSGMRAQKLQADLEKGDYVFFHTTIQGRKCVTAYFVVDRVLQTKKARAERAIAAKFQNPHLSKSEEDLAARDDAILFGDPITSRKLDRPLRFDRSLASRLSLGIKFPAGRQETQAIGSATRNWRTLTESDVKLLLKAIESDDDLERLNVLKTTEEVSETLEKDVEDYLARNPHLISKDLKLIARQLPIESGRIDLLFETKQGNLVIVEVKLGRVGRDAMRQVQDYMHELRASEPHKRVDGVLVCAGVMPAFEAELRKQSKVRIMVYGWRIEAQPW